MTDLLDLYRSSIPTAESKLRGQAAARDLNLVLRALQHKLRTKAKLGPVDQHLVRSFRGLQNSYFAPSVLSVALSISQAFIKPLVLAGSFGLAVVLVAGEPLSALPEEEAVAAADLGDEPAAEPELDVPQLALALAAAPIAEPSLNLTGGLPPLPAAAPIPVSAAPEQQSFSERSFSERTAEAQLGQQRNLVKFISGIIAAFRPSIKDCGLIARHIVELSTNENIDPIYVAAVIAIESRFSSTAESNAGALGLMQLMPTTAKEVANSKSHRTAHLVDPKTNIRLGISYLKQLEEKYRGNRFLALAAYNWGPANINKSHGKYRRIPGSVRRYSTTVLERTLAWRRHFDKATISAQELRTVSREEAAKNS